ncbi:MAG: hypothetical protein U0531_02190 [Dehalococcoidia bacterium]
MKELRSQGALPMVHAENADSIYALERELIAAGAVTLEFYSACACRSPRPRRSAGPPTSRPQRRGHRCTSST